MKHLGTVLLCTGNVGHIGYATISLSTDPTSLFQSFEFLSVVACCVCARFPTGISLRAPRRLSPEERGARRPLVGVWRDGKERQRLSAAGAALSGSRGTAWERLAETERRKRAGARGCCGDEAQVRGLVLLRQASQVEELLAARRHQIRRVE